MTAPSARVFVLLALVLGGCGPSSGEAPRAGISEYARAALSGPAGDAPIPLQLLTPGEGAVIPWTFPEMEFRWADRFAADAFRIRVFGPRDDMLLEVTTVARFVRASRGEWNKVREGVGEGGAFTVELVAASVLPSGRVLRGPTSVVTHARFSGEGEHPTGTVYYAPQLRPRGAPPGLADQSFRLLSPVRVSMTGQEEWVLHDIFDSWIQPPGVALPQQPGPSYADLGVPDWAQRPQESVASRSLDFTGLDNRNTRPVSRDLYQKPEGACMGCHVTQSPDATYVAMLAAFDDNRPGGGGDTLHTLFVVREADRDILVQKQKAFFPRFYPLKPSLLAYSQWANEFEDGFLASVYKADIRVVDVLSGVESAVPGASEPKHCEIAPDWSPDGRWLVFSRSVAGEPCDGERGRLEIARVPWNDGRGGPATVLVEADGANTQPRYSPDGRWIVFFRTSGGYYAKGSADLWVVPAEGGTARSLDISTKAMDDWPVFSPDGRWIAFLSNRDRVDKVRGFVARFYEDGRVAPPVPLPGAGAPDVSLSSIDWTR